MDLLGKSNRVSYAAAWGTISYLAADMVLGETTIVALEGPNYVTSECRNVFHLECVIFTHTISHVYADFMFYL